LFVNLHAHSEGSLLDGAGTPSQRAAQAVELGQNALSISDHGNIIMAPQHIKECKARDIKPIVGMEAYFKPDRKAKDRWYKLTDADGTDRYTYQFHLLLTAINQQGFNNLIKISSEAQLTGHMRNKPSLDYELLEKYNAGLICSSACISGILPYHIAHGNDHEARNVIEKYLDIFGDRYRLEIMPHAVPAQKVVNIALANYSIEYGIPLLATADSHYPYKDWTDTQDVLLMISTGQSLSKREKQREAGEDVYEMGNVPLHMFSEDEMYEYFAENHPTLTQNTVKESIEESQKISDLVEEYDIDRTNKLPKVKTGKKSSLDTLKSWCAEGMKRIGKENDKEYVDRLWHELEVLEEMGVVDYFVLVGKMTRWAREQGIRISSGRGSAAGSLVCYLIRITTIDPIAHELLFERFLNPNRKGLPDIDLDFEPSRIPEVKDWLVREYGEDKVCDISAFGTYHPKGALKDVARVMDVPFPEINTVTKVIPEAGDVGGAGNVPPLATLRDQYSVIDKFAEKYPEVWKHALRLEGQTKQLGKHAAGVIVTDKPITDYMPLLKGKESTVTAWSARASADTISEMNILKIDILSLDSLDKQGEIIRIIEDQYGDKINVDDLPVASDPEAIEPEVMDMFTLGNTLGVFQYGGSRGITNFLRHTKPDRFEDLIAVNALYRPGPLEGGDAFKYGDLKNGKAPINYWHESVKPILEKTYGIMAYQEQMQQIAIALGNFNAADADDMRKATSKIYRMGRAEAQAFLSDYKEQWDKGCKENGLSQSEADHIWERMLSFGSYSFNRSHAASYSLFGYQDAWLKYHYPQAAYAALLTQHPDKADEIIREAKNQDVDILPPDVNKSEADFTVTDEGLRYGLRAIKYVGDVAIANIIKNRPYSSIKDVEERTAKNKVNKRVIEYLYYSGAFDSLGARSEMSDSEKRKEEIDSIHVALSGTPDIKKLYPIYDERINTESEFDRMTEGMGITFGGEIASVKEVKIKSGKNKGKPMAFVSVLYKDNKYEATFFSQQFKKYSDILYPGNLIISHGRKSDRDSILVDSCTSMAKLVDALGEEND
jgi:DNA polymerase-3 subunit alpha